MDMICILLEILSVVYVKSCKKFLAVDFLEIFELIAFYQILYFFDTNIFLTHVWKLLIRK